MRMYLSDLGVCSSWSWLISSLWAACQHPQQQSQQTGDLLWLPTIQTCFLKVLHSALHSNAMRFFTFWGRFVWVMTVNTFFFFKLSHHLFFSTTEDKKWKGWEGGNSSTRESGGLWIWQMDLEGSGADNTDLISRLWHINDKLQWCYLSLPFDSHNQAHVL